MTEFEAARSSKTMMYAVIVIAIIGTGAIAVVYFGGLGPGPNGTTTTTTTTGTTTTTEPGGVYLTIVTRHDISIHYVFEPEFLASDFAIQNNIVDLKWKTPDGQFWDDLIDLGQVDVCWGGGPTLFDQLARDNRLSPLTSPLMQEVAARFNDTIAGAAMKRNNSVDQLIWMAAAISSFGFTVNYDFLDDYSLPVPKSWTDLANMIYGSLLPGISTIAMGNAPQTTSNTRIYEIIVQALGWDAGWINMARMAGNADIYPGSVETQNAAERGDAGVSMSIDFYGYLTMARNPDCAYIVPEGQTIVNGDPIAIAFNSAKKNLAEGFIDFVLSPYGQSLWLDRDVRRMPVMREAFFEPDVGNVTEDYLSFNQTIATQGIEFNDTISLLTNGAFVPYWASVLAEAHTELVNCWAKIIEAYDGGYIDASEVDFYAGLMGLPVTVQDPKTLTSEKFTLDYAIQINHDMIYDSTFASQMKTRWTAAAKLQYIDVRAQVQAIIDAG